MSEHAAPAIKPANDPAFKLPASLASLQLPLLAGGLLLLLVGFGLAYSNAAKIGFSAYLVSFIYCLTLSIGCLFFVIVQHLVRAGWSVVVRRIAELFMIMIVPLAVLFIPVLVATWMSNGLYIWTLDGWMTETVGVDPEIWKAKSGWLDPGWFTIRSLIYFAVYIGLAVFYYRGSTLQDETGQKSATEKLQYWAGPAAMLFALTTTFAAFDWVMSLAPMWFSTMFGVYMFAGAILAAHCVICLFSYLMQRCGAMRDEVTVEHYHDLGKLIFGFTFFWTYISFSQYLLIWYGNIPEETEWFWIRQTNGWGSLSVVIILFHWIVPFMGTLSRHVRRRPWAMAAWSGYLLVMHFIDVFWMIMPEAHQGITESITAVGVAGAILCGVGMLALMVGLVLSLAGNTKLLPVRDPRLGESLAFENI
ncbi:MAG: hypothetical protein AAF958_04330 [Planctomycetota bacterium]